ncbi:MAG TPA: two-component regulator propeller domain-containing protein, partial [Chitinophagaceae bacterium]|nr:two-component regulator propeller domain-containing protein [Chitinophagaceae bacterium]
MFQHLTTKDGLASDITRFIFQDLKGFYWLGYDNGFQKFDGKNFTGFSFGNEYIKSNILEGPDIPPVEDNTGRIFVYNEGDVYVYNPSGRVDTIQIYDYADDRFSDIFTFCKDELDNIWIVSERGIYKYDKDINKCVLWLSITPRAMTGSLTTIIYDTHKKCLWLARDSNIFCVDIHSKKISKPFFSVHAGKNDLPKTISFTGFWMDNNQNLWISSWNGSIYKYNTITYKKERFDAFNYGKNKNQPDISIPLCFLEDRQKHIWIGCLNGGLYSYNNQTNLFHAVAASNNIPHFLHYDYYISALYEDKEGNIWVGTDKGINIFNPVVQQFNTLDENTFPKTEIEKIFQTSTGDILVGTWGKGWFMYDKDFQLKKQF